MQKIPQSRKWQPTPIFLPGKSHRQRSLEGYSPWGHKVSDTTERLSMHAFTMLYITTPGLIYLITGSLYLLLITISEAAVEVGLIKNWVPRDESTLTIVFQQLWERKGGLGPLLAVKYESIRKTPRGGHHGISQLLPDPGEILFPANFAAGFIYICLGAWLMSCCVSSSSQPDFHSFNRGSVFALSDCLDYRSFPLYCSKLFFSMFIFSTVLFRIRVKIKNLCKRIVNQE